MEDRKGFRLVKKGEDRRIFRRKIIWHRASTFLRGLLVTAAMVAFLVFLFYQYKNHTYTEILITSTTEKLNLPSNSYIDNGGAVITYSRDGISAVDTKGRNIWNNPYEMQKPVVRSTEGIVAVCDYGGHIIQVITGDGKTEIIDTNLPIVDFCVSREGRIATITDDDEVSWVSLYSSGGEKLVEIKCTMSKTGFPLAVALSGEVMGVSYFYLDGEAMKSSITFYNFGGVGENVTDHIVSSYDYANGVIPILACMDHENFLGIGDNRILFFHGEKKPVSTHDIILNEKIIGAYTGAGNSGLVFYDNTGEKKYRLDVYNKSGEKLYSYLFDNDYKNILMGKETVMIYNESDCILLNNAGQEKYAGKFPEKVIFVGSTESDKKFVAVTKNYVGTMVFE